MDYALGALISYLLRVGTPSQQSIVRIGFMSVRSLFGDDTKKIEIERKMEYHVEKTSNIHIFS